MIGTVLLLFIHIIFSRSKSDLDRSSDVSILFFHLKCCSLSFLQVLPTLWGLFKFCSHPLWILASPLVCPNLHYKVQLNLHLFLHSWLLCDILYLLVLCHQIVDKILSGRVEFNYCHEYLWLVIFRAVVFHFSLLFLCMIQFHTHLEMPPFHSSYLGSWKYRAECGYSKPLTG